MNILVVDTDPMMRKVIRFILGVDGHDVICASTADEAVEMSVANKPDILVLDTMLPDSDRSSVRSLLADANCPMVLFLIPGEQMNGSAGCPSFTFGECLAKPFSPEELSAAVQRLEDIRSGRLVSFFRTAARSGRVAVSSGAVASAGAAGRLVAFTQGTS